MKNSFIVGMITKGVTLGVFVALNTSLYTLVQPASASSLVSNLSDDEGNEPSGDQPSKDDKVGTDDNTKVVANFECRQINGTPTTIVTSSAQPGKVIPMIAWQYGGFGPKYTPQRRCQMVSQRLQKLHNSGQLQFITTGLIRGENILCGQRQEGEGCDGSNQIYTLRPNEDPMKEMADFKSRQEGQSTDVLYQSNGRPYIKMSDFLRNAPTMQVNRNQSKPSTGGRRLF